MYLAPRPSPPSTSLQVVMVVVVVLIMLSICLLQALIQPRFFEDHEEDNLTL